MIHQTLHGVLYGHGKMGQLHASKLAERTDVTVSIIDPAKGLNPEVPGSVDFAIVATPTHTHSGLALPWLERGVPCLIEKPISNSMQEAQILAKFPNVSVGHVERFNPVFAVTQDVLPGFIDIQRLAQPSTRSRDIDVIDDLMIHDLDLLLAQFRGPVHCVAATGLGVNNTRPDIVNARLEIAAENRSPITVNITASRVSENNVRTWRMIEHYQYWSLDLQQRRVKRVDWSSGQAQPLEINVPSWDQLAQQHAAFLDAIRENRPFTVGGKDGLDALTLGNRIRSCLH